MAFQGFENETPFAAEHLLLLDEEGAMNLVMVVEATYRMPRGEGALVPVAGKPIARDPLYRADPAVSSMLCDTQAVVGKAAADVLLAGHARPERGKADEMMVSVEIGAWKKSARVVGDRVWRSSVGGLSPSAPKPFDRMPLVYERAFGGTDRSVNPNESDPRNPVGAGLVAIEGAALPNLEDPSSPITSPGDRPAPMSFGPVAPSWMPRRSFAGTFDDRHREERAPRLPLDFQRRFWNAAPVDQQIEGFLKGGERVVISGVSEHGALRFTLPKQSIAMRVRMRGRGATQIRATFDTLAIDADEGTLTATYRAALRVHRRVHDVERAVAEVAA